MEVALGEHDLLLDKSMLSKSHIEKASYMNLVPEEAPHLSIQGHLA